MSAPPVRIESKAWTDHRYNTLALELGLPDRDVALIRVATIWRWQTEHYTDEAPTYSVPRSVVVGALNSLRGPEAMVAADLAEVDADGRLRIRGGRDDQGKSRIDWLWHDRESRRQKGRLRAAQAAADGREAGRYQPRTSRTPAADQPDTSRGPAGHQPATSSPDSDLRTPDSSSPSLPQGGAADHLAHAIARLNAARAEVDPKAPPIPPMSGQPGTDLLEHLRQLPAEERRRRLDHALDVLIAEVRAKGGDVDELRLANVSGPRAWHRLQAATVASATRSSRGRDGPAGRRPAIGRAPPSTDHSTEAIDPKDIAP